MSKWQKVRYVAGGAALGLAGSSLLQVGLKKKELKKQSENDMVPKIPVIRMAGNITAPPNKPFNPNAINLEAFEKPLKEAFAMKNVKAIVIEMNSPGGSPAQSSLLHSHIQSLRAKQESKEVPVLCYCTDLCASGGYYIASACSEILVLPSTIVGSIGVVSPDIGLVDALQKLGVEDRTATAGASKNAGSPFRPVDPVAVRKKAVLLTDLHEDFRFSPSLQYND